MAELVSKAEFGRRIGVSAPMVQKYIRRGLPMAADGRIDWNVGKLWHEQNVRRHHRRMAEPTPLPTSSAGNAETAAKASARKLSAEADLKELELARLRGEVLPTFEVEDAITKGTLLVRDVNLALIEELPSKLYPAASHTSPELLRCREIVKDHVYRLLNQLADTWKAYISKPKNEPKGLPNGKENHKNAVPQATVDG